MTDSSTGYAAVAVAVFFFGSNFVPVKKYDTGDGMFYQWLMASAIFLWGLGLQLYLCYNPPPSTASGSKRAAYESARLIVLPKMPCAAKRSAVVSPGGGV